MPDKQKTLVLFSGGKDSFLTACRLASQDHEVHLISFNNGSIACEENLLHGVARLQNRYGEDKIRYDGAYCTAATIWRLNEAWSCMPWHELGEKYPDLTNVQMTCMHCQTAMWIAAIAYAKAKHIRAIATGYKDTDEFCTGMPQWLDRITEIAAKNGISVVTPLWTTPEWGEDKDFGRDMELMRRAFEPQVLEPKCMLGRPSEKPGISQAEYMMAYFDNVMREKVQDGIDNLARIFEYIGISGKAMERIEYPVPTGENGMF